MRIVGLCVSRFRGLRIIETGYAVVERDDGVVYQLHGAIAGTELPHDIRHLVVERELRVTDGIWGGIAQAPCSRACGTCAGGARRTRRSGRTNSSGSTGTG